MKIGKLYQKLTVGSSHHKRQEHRTSSLMDVEPNQLITELTKKKKEEHHDNKDEASDSTEPHSASFHGDIGYQHTKGRVCNGEIDQRAADPKKEETFEKDSLTKEKAQVEYEALGDNQNVEEEIEKRLTDKAETKVKANKCVEEQEEQQRTPQEEAESNNKNEAVEKLGGEGVKVKEQKKIAALGGKTQYEEEELPTEKAETKVKANKCVEEQEEQQKMPQEETESNDKTEDAERQELKMKIKGRIATEEADTKAEEETIRKTKEDKKRRLAAKHEAAEAIRKKIELEEQERIAAEEAAGEEIIKLEKERLKRLEREKQEQIARAIAEEEAIHQTKLEKKLRLAAKNEAGETIRKKIVMAKTMKPRKLTRTEVDLCMIHCAHHGQPNREKMLEQIAKKDPTEGITLEVVVSLPWLFNGAYLDQKKLNKIIAGELSDDED